MQALTGYLEAVTKTLNELQRLHELNVELLEQLDVACAWLIDNHVQVPNESVFYSLLFKSKALLEEMQTDEPAIIQYSCISRRKVTALGEKHGTDEEVPEPHLPLYMAHGFSV